MIQQRNNTQKSEDQEKRFQKIKRIVSSVVIAIIVWFVIVNVVNPKITITMANIPVSFTGESDLRGRGFVVVDKDKLPQFNVKVRGTRSDLISARSRVYVEIDLDGITDVGSVTVAPVVRMPSYISLEKQRFSTIELNIEPGYEKKVPVIVAQEGDDRQKSKGRIVMSEPQYDTVAITGSKAATEEVHACLVTVDVADITEGGTTVYVSRLVDENYNDTEHRGSIYYSSTVPVDNHVYERHTVPVRIQTDKELEKRLVVRYDKDAAEKLTIDVGVPKGTTVPKFVEAVIENKEYEMGEITARMKLSEPEGVYIPYKTIDQTLFIEQYQTKKLSVAAELKNIPANLTAAQTKLTFEMELKVPESTKDEVKAYIDCSQYTAGDHEAKLMFYSRHITPAGHGTVKISLKEKSN